MVGGLSGGGAKGKRSYPPGGPPLRASSVGDFNEVDEDSWSINQMPDHEVLAEFEKMLGMNFTYSVSQENPDSPRNMLLIKKFTIFIQ